LRALQQFLKWLAAEEITNPRPRVDVAQEHLVRRQHLRDLPTTLAVPVAKRIQVITTCSGLMITSV
jgi:hypothetical protein